MDQERLSQITITGISMTIARLDAMATLLIDLRGNGDQDLCEKIYAQYRQTVEESTKELSLFLTRHYTDV